MAPHLEVQRGDTAERTSPNNTIKDNEVESFTTAQNLLQYPPPPLLQCLVLYTLWMLCVCSRESVFYCITDGVCLNIIPYLYIDVSHLDHPFGTVEPRPPGRSDVRRSDPGWRLIHFHWFPDNPIQFVDIATGLHSKRELAQHNMWKTDHPLSRVRILNGNFTWNLFTKF